MDEQSFLATIAKAKAVDAAAVQRGSSNVAPVRSKAVKPRGGQMMSQRQPIMEDFNAGLDEKESALDAMYLSQAAQMTSHQAPVQQYPQQQYTPQPQYPQQGTNHTRMPSFIKESMESHPIDTSVFDPNPLNRVKIPEQQQPIQEQVVARPQANTYAPQAGVDYSVMRAIINECLETKLKEHSVLNEGSSPIKTILLKEGMIKIVDNKGNIFEAKLKKIGNINDDK